MNRPDEELDRLLALCLDRIEDEGTAAVDALCAERPELASALRRRVGLLAAASLVEVDAVPRRLPEKVGDFELLERLGEGAMGVVHRARQTSTGRIVAVKLVRPEQLWFPAARARFRREVELSARLAHPSILPVLAVGETDGVPWFALELVRGASLSALIAALRARFGSPARVDPAAIHACLRAATPEALRIDLPADARAPRSYRAWALAVATAVARALAHAHGHGVLHRDVKPSNVLVGADGRVFLTDFGLAGEPGEGSLTGTRTAIGSLPYMAPEVLEGARPDAASDVYGAGALAYELLTLRRPFEEQTSAALVRAILAAQPAAPRKLGAGLGADDEAVLLRALERAPERRYATAWELALDLTALAERRPTRARPAGPWLRAQRFVQRRPAASAAIALAVLSIVGTPTAVAWSESRARRRVEQANAELDRALAREREQRERADLNLDRATHAVDVLLAETGGVLLDQVPRMQALKRDLLERALAVLAELEPQSASEPARVLQGASVDLAAGTARLELGEREAAREHLERGLARLAACAGCEAHDAARVRALAVRIERQAARVAHQSGDLAAAERHARAAVERAQGAAEPKVQQERLLALLELYDLTFYGGRVEEARAWMARAEDELAAGAPAWDEIDALHLRAQVHGTRGSALYVEGDLAGAARDLRAALDAIEAIGARDPEALEPLHQALSTGINLAAAQMGLGELAEAEATLARARAAGEELVGLFPSAPAFQVDLAGLLINLGLLRGEVGDAAGCREAWEAAAQAGRALAAAPDVPAEALYQAGLACSNLASLDHDEGRNEEAIAASREAEACLRRALERTPGNVLTARALEFSILTRANAELALGRTAETRRLLDEAGTVAPAERLAQRALTEGWLKLAEALPEEERAECRERALATLVRAVELGWDDPADLVENPFLDPLRAMPGFPAAE